MAPEHLGSHSLVRHARWNARHPGMLQLKQQASNGILDTQYCQPKRALELTCFCGYLTATSLSKDVGPSAVTVGTWIKEAARDAGKGDGELTTAELPAA